FDHFVVSAGGPPGSATTGLWLVDRLGDATEIAGLSPLHRSVGTVAVDPASGDLWTSGGYIQSRYLTLYRIPIQGRQAGTAVAHQFTSIFASATDLHVLPGGTTLLVLLGST